MAEVNAKQESANKKKNNAICPLAKKCGGCQLQNLAYRDQLILKRREIIKLLGRYGNVPEVIGMEDPTHYRCKVQAAFGLTRSGKVISGVYQSASHRIVNVNDCLIEDKKADEIIVFIRGLLPSFGILPYNEDTGRGILRHCLVRKGYYTGEYMVVLVTASSMLPSSKNLAGAIISRFPEVKTVVQNINCGDDSMVLGEREKILYGKGRIEDVICNKRFLISPRSFYQINPVMTEKLYSYAVASAGLKGSETVIDAYCGTGTIGIVAAENAGRVIGAELNRDAVRDAVLNAKRNETENIEFVAADAGEFMKQFAESGGKCDVVFTDPPRAGCSKQFIDSVLCLSPLKIVYISCNPQTQARDIQLFSKGGYKVKSIQPFDMFPYTSHVENIVLLTK